MTAQQQNAQGCQHTTIAGSTSCGLLKGQCRDCGFQVYSESGSRLDEPPLDDLDRLRTENAALRAALADAVREVSETESWNTQWWAEDWIPRAEAALAATPAETELAVLEVARRIAEREGFAAAGGLQGIIDRIHQREAQPEPEPAGA